MDGEIQRCGISLLLFFRNGDSEGSRARATLAICQSKYFRSENAGQRAFGGAKDARGMIKRRYDRPP